MTLDEAKKYLRIDATDEDDLILSLITAATGYINGQTGKTQVKTGIGGDGLPTYADISTDALYNLIIKQMITHWFDNRAVETPGQISKISYSVDAIINHIALCGDYA